MKYRSKAGLALVACTLLLASCGSSSGVTNAGSNTTLASSWVSKNVNVNGGAAILTWTITGTQAAGSLSATSLSSSGDSARHFSAPFSGTVSGESVNLHFNGSGYNVSGTVTPTQLSIAFPGATNGQISNIVLVPGTESTYNKEVSTLDNEAFVNNQKAQEAKQQEQAAQQQAQAIQQQEQAAIAQADHDKQVIQSDASTVSNDLSSLQSDESQLSTDVAGTASDLASENNALSRTYVRLEKTESLVSQYGTGSGNGVCYEAEDDVGYDASENVYYDAKENVGYDATENVLPDISSVQSGIQQLQSDFASLQSAEAAMVAYLPSGTPTSSQVQAAISTANANISNAVSTTNGYISQANAYVSTAYGYTDTAYKVGNCGSPPSLPTPVPPISASEASNS